MSKQRPSDGPLARARAQIETARRERSTDLNLAGLRLTTEHLATLCPEIATLTALTALDLSNNKFTTLPEAVGKLTALTTLDLDNNQLTTLPESLCNFTALTALHLFQNQLTTLPEAVGKLTALTTLNLSDNKLTTLPEAVGKLTALTTLSLSYNELTTLPEAVGNLTALTTLDLSNNKFTTLPEAVGNLTALTTLDLDNNQLTTLPEAVGSLTALTTLELTKNRLTKLPETLSNLTALKKLRLGGNRLDIFPVSLFNLTALQYLAFQGNQLTTLPESLCNLTALTALHLFQNQLTTLPEAVGKLTALTTLNLSNNKLTTLPEAVGKLTALTTLDLSYNELTTLPEAVGNLTALTTLDLSNNKFTTLPEAVGNFTALTTLDLSNNKFTTLPEAVGNLTALTTLDISNNKFTTLPEAVGKLTALTELHLSDNPLPADLIKLADTNVEDALAYIRELKKDGGGTPIREAKLVIVGEGGVGKTCLLRALKGEPFKKQKSTAGVEVNVEALAIEHKAKGKKTAEYALNAWDFAGQDIYRVTHQFFFTHRAIYLVLWNVRAGPTQGAVEFWLNTIKQRVGEHARVFVVATHVKTEKTIEDIRKENLKAKYGNMIAGFAEVDSKTGFGVQELRKAIARTTAELDGIDDPVPAKYLVARDELKEKIKREWSTFTDFAQASGLDAGGARRLAFLLSTWGRIVYFGDDGADGGGGEVTHEGTLADYVVLKPEWLTKAIALILEDKQTKSENAVLKHARLPEIWEKHGKKDRPTYARANHPFLMALMEKFGISFRLGVNPPKARTSLVPQLIRNDRPPKGKEMPWVPGDAAAGTPEASLSCVLSENPPPGLVPLMIARTHHLSCKDTHWETGAFLRHERFGEAHMQLVDRELRFIARGIFPPHLLGELSATADRLLKEWEGVNWELAVPCPICPTVLPPGKPHGNFPLEAIAAFKKENPDSESLPCYACRKSVTIERLLSGWPGGVGPLAIIERKIDGIASGVAKVQDGIDQLLLRDPQNAAEAAEQFSRLYAFLTDQRRHAPCTFSAICGEPEGWFAKKAKGLFRVTLWCENPNGPHPVVPIGSSTEAKQVSGEYLVPFDREWVKRWAPAMKWGLLALKAAVPIGGAVLKAGVDEALFKGIEKQLNVGEKAIAALPSGGLTTVKRPTVEDGLMRSPDGAELREFHAAMAERFKDGRWGDLVYAELPDKSWRWMCTKCRALLSPGIQKSLG